MRQYISVHVPPRLPGRRIWSNSYSVPNQAGNIARGTFKNSPGFLGDREGITPARPVITTQTMKS